jgi:hypothetical protein
MEWITHTPSKPPVDETVIVEARCRDGEVVGPWPALEMEWTVHGCDSDIVAYRIVNQSTKQTTAPDVLAAAAKHMADRASQYDKPAGERSMDATVRAFNAVSGKNLTESEGWLLLACLKAVRLFQRPGYHEDSAQDLTAYCALLAESKSKEKA